MVSQAQKRDTDDAVDFNAMVLGTNNWPLGQHQTDFAIPREIQATYDRFTRFYNDAHSYVRFSHACACGSS